MRAPPLFRFSDYVKIYQDDDATRAEDALFGFRISRHAAAAISRREHDASKMPTAECCSPSMPSGAISFDDAGRFAREAPRNARMPTPPCILPRQRLIIGAPLLSSSSAAPGRLIFSRRASAIFCRRDYSLMYFASKVNTYAKMH